MSQKKLGQIQNPGLRIPIFSEFQLTATTYSSFKSQLHILCDSEFIIFFYYSVHNSTVYGIQGPCKDGWKILST